MVDSRCVTKLGGCSRSGRGFPFGVGVGTSDDNPGEGAIILNVDSSLLNNSLPPQIEGVRTKIVRADNRNTFSQATRTQAQAVELSEAELKRGITAKEQVAARLVTHPAVFGVGVGASDDRGHGQMAAYAAAMANQMLQLKYSRTDELEADKWMGDIRLQLNVKDMKVAQT